MSKFTNEFFWGAATSAHQVEGGNNNDWTEWEKENAERLAKEGKVKAKRNYISGKACNQYNLFREDFKLASKLRHNAYRFSIEWSRVEPEEGRFDDKEILHYREVIKELKRNKIEPFVTLWHWTNPLWVRDQGGWENKKIVQDFKRYVEKITGEVSGVKFWIPINEPTIYIGTGYVIGRFPPQIKSFFKARRVIKNLAEANKEAYKIIHRKFENKVMVGSAHNIHWHVPCRRWNLLDIAATKLINYLRDTKILNQFINYQDFIGLNYYFRDTIKFVFWGGNFGLIDVQNPNKELSDIGWDIFPEGIYHILRRLESYKKPIFITENGIADAKDTKRTKFIKEHLRWISKAINKGVDVRGYFYWSLLDNFEWDKGFWPRFGLLEVNYKTQKRTIRPSALEYKKIIEKGFIE